MANLDELLAGEEPVERKKEEVGPKFDELPISKFAYEKAFRYAKLILDGRRDSVEIGGFLTKPKNAPDRIARDAFLARDQVVSRTEYKVGAEDVVKAARELEERGEMILGWWHSHGRFDTFHSETDRKNQMVLLNQISPSNYVISTRERNYDGLQSRVEGNSLFFFSPDNPDATFKLDLKDEDPRLVAERLKVLEEKRIGFAYSFVVNWHRWVRRRTPYCEIATRNICRDCSDVKDKSARVSYRVFDCGEYSINDDELLAEIKEKVRVVGEWKSSERKYFLPSIFEEKRAAGTLTVPDLGSETPTTRGKINYDGEFDFGREWWKKI